LVAAPTRPRPSPGPGTKAALEAGRSAATGLAVRAGAQPKEVVSAAGSAVVAAAKVGRIFGRSGLRLARQLPGAAVVEREAAKLGRALADVRRILEQSQPVLAVMGNADEQRTMLLLKDARADPEPLRTAMSELLDRSATDRSSGREYLFGSIVSQLVPDEARIIAALATGRPFAAADLVAKAIGRSTSQVVLANASTVGRAAAVVLPDNTPTYLTRLYGFGLVEYGPADDSLSADYDEIATDRVVTAARRAAAEAKQGGIRLRRKTVTLSTLGREFWAASAPRR
jgi:hypothetical protein